MKNTLKFNKTKFSSSLILYLLKLFLPVFFISLLFFVSVLELGDVFYNLVSYMENKVPARSILKIVLFYAPKCISYAMPISVLFASSYVLGNLYARKELTVIFLSGVSLLKFVLPLLLLSFLLSIAMFFFEDRVVIQSLVKKNALLKEVTSQNKDLDASDVALLSDFTKVVYTADYYDSTNKILRNPKIVHRNEEGLLDIVIIAESANWDEETQRWVLSAAKVYSIDSKNSVKLSSESDFDFLNEKPESFERIVVNIDEMDSSKAKAFLNELKQRGFSQSEYIVKYYQRFSFPFTIFIVLFLSISFGGYLKKNVLLMSLLISLSFAVLYYVSQMCMAVLASWNLISPLLAAFLPFIAFFFLSIYLLKKART